MKKNVFFALFACAALVFVGCEPNTPTPTPDGGSTTDAVISVTPETLLMAAGETQKLTATVAPQGTQLQITWTSDNQEVVTVSPAGIVTAVAAGKANIIASAEGATADTCVVTVSNDAILNNFELGGVGLFGDIQLIPGFDTVISGYNCQLGNIELIAWDANLVFVDGQGFAGDGYVIVADEFPMYWVVENGEVLGYIGSEQGYFISEEVKGVSPYAAPAGKMVDLQKYGDAWKGLYFATTDAEAEAAVESRLDTVLCPWRYIYGYVLSTLPAFSSDFHYNFLLSNIIGSISKVSNISKKQVGEAVLELFPHLRPVEKQQITDYVPSIPNLDTDAMDDASYPQARLYPHFLKRSLIAEAQEALDAQLQVSGVCDADIVNVGAYQLCMYCPHNATCPYGKHDQREDE